MTARQNAGLTETSASWLDLWAREPALVEFVLLGFIGISLYLLLSRLARLVADARARRAVHDFLLGVEQALAHDVRGAAHRLRRVLDVDPENRAARLLYGLVLAEHGEPAEAHRQHLELHLGFDKSSRRNDLALAENLIAVACARDAIEHAERAVDKAPHRPDGLRILFRAQLTAGLPSAAAETGLRLFAVLPDGEERARVRRRIADAFALAGETQLKADDPAGAKRMLGKARAAEPESQSVRRLDAQLAWREQGEAMLLPSTSDPAAVVSERDPVTGDRRSSGSEDHPAIPGESALSPYDRDRSQLVPANERASALLASLAEFSPYCCQRCRTPLDTGHLVCPHCGASGSVIVAEPNLLTAIDAPSHVVDAIEENDAHIARVLDRIDSLGIGAVDSSAARELIDIGAPAVGPALQRAISVVDATPYVDILQRMGACVLPDLFAAYDQAKERYQRSVERSRFANLIGRVVQGYDQSAIVVFRELLGTDDPDLRKILVDYFLGLHDPKAFDAVLEQFPPVEVIHRLNLAPESVLIAFLQNLEADSFLVEVILPDAVFVRDEALLDAVAMAADPATLIRILERRGFSRSMTRAVIDRLLEPNLQKTCHRLLDGFGTAALEHQIASFANLDEPIAVRDQLAYRFAREGSSVVSKLCDCFGTSATPLDDSLIAILARIGATEPLLEAYAQGGLLEKFAQRFRQRYEHRRSMIVRVLGSIGGTAARSVLVSLREEETDKDLELRIGRAIHQIDHPCDPQLDPLHEKEAGDAP